jgi:hypothetical protein
MRNRWAGFDAIGGEEILRRTPDTTERLLKHSRAELKGWMVVDQSPGHGGQDEGTRPVQSRA